MKSNKILMKYDHIVFDLDGTLIDSLHDVVAALNHGLSEVTSKAFTYDEAKCWIGAGLEPLIDRALSSANITSTRSSMSHFSKRFLNYYEENPAVYSKLYPHVETALDEASALAKTLSICSNKPSKMVHKVLEAFNIAHYFDYISGGDSFDVKKPNKEHIFMTNEQINPANVSRCLMVGDSDSDILAACHAGMDSVLVTYGYMKDEEIKNRATCVIDCISELKPILRASGVRQEGVTC